MRVILVGAFVLFLVFPMFAQDRTEERAAYDSEMKQLRTDPAKLAQMRRAFTLVAEMLLGRLGYGIASFDGARDELTEKALRAYEKNRGIPVTGDPLSFDTIEQIQKDMESLDYQPVSLPRLFVYVTDWNDGYFMAKGTWTLSGEAMAWPEQAVEFKCYRDTATCLETTATVSRLGGSPSLSVESEWYDVERWDENEIVTKPKDYECTRYVKRANRIQKSVTGLRSSIADDKSCKALDAKDKLMVLSDGIKVYIDLLAQKRKANESLVLVSPEAKKAFAIEK